MIEKSSERKVATPLGPPRSQRAAAPRRVAEEPRVSVPHPDPNRTFSASSAARQPDLMRIIGTRHVSRVAIGGASWSLGDHQDAGNASPPSHNELGHCPGPGGPSRCGLGIRCYQGRSFPARSRGLPCRCQPGALRRDCELSLRTLRRSRIDLCQLHRCDNPAVNLAESVEALARLRAEGKIRFVGFCIVTAGQVRLASTIATIDTVRNRYSPLARDDEVLSHLRRSRHHLSRLLPARRQPGSGRSRWASSNRVCPARRAAVRAARAAAASSMYMTTIW